MNGMSTYTGIMYINEGALVFGSSAALAAISAGAIVPTGASLDLAGQDYTSAEPLTINTTAWGASVILT